MDAHQSRHSSRAPSPWFSPTSTVFSKASTSTSSSNSESAGGSHNDHRLELPALPNPPAYATTLTPAYPHGRKPLPIPPLAALPVGRRNLPTTPASMDKNTNSFDKGKGREYVPESTVTPLDWEKAGIRRQMGLDRGMSVRSAVPLYLDEREPDEREGREKYSISHGREDYQDSREDVEQVVSEPVNEHAREEFRRDGKREEVRREREREMDEPVVIYKNICGTEMEKLRVGGSDTEKVVERHSPEPTSSSADSHSSYRNWPLKPDHGSSPLNSVSNFRSTSHSRLAEPHYPLISADYKPASTSSSRPASPDSLIDCGDTEVPEYNPHQVETYPIVASKESESFQRGREPTIELPPPSIPQAGHFDFDAGGIDNMRSGASANSSSEPQYYPRLEFDHLATKYIPQLEPLSSNSTNHIPPRPPPPIIPSTPIAPASSYYSGGVKRVMVAELSTQRYESAPIPTSIIEAEEQEELADTEGSYSSHRPSHVRRESWSSQNSSSSTAIFNPSNPSSRNSYRSSPFQPQLAVSPQLHTGQSPNLFPPPQRSNMYGVSSPPIRSAPNYISPISSPGSTPYSNHARGNEGYFQQTPNQMNIQGQYQGMPQQGNQQFYSNPQYQIPAAQNPPRMQVQYSGPPQFNNQPQRTYPRPPLLAVQSHRYSTQSLPDQQMINQLNSRRPQSGMSQHSLHPSQQVFPGSQPPQLQHTISLPPPPAPHAGYSSFISGASGGSTYGTGIGTSVTSTQAKGEGGGGDTATSKRRSRFWGLG